MPRRSLSPAEQARQAQLVAVFNDTLARTQEGVIPKSHLIPSIQATSPVQGAPTKRAKISVVNQDCLVAAQLFAKSNKNVLLMNNANAHTPGGGVAHGTIAQEEDIMRRSNAYPSLLNVQGNTTTPGTGRFEGRRFYNQTVNNALLGSGAIVSKEVVAFKDANYKPCDPFKFDLYTCAAHKLNEEETQRYGFRKADGRVDYDKYRKTMESKIRTYIYSAIGEGCSVLMPGALGCGAFKSFEEGGVVPEGYTAEIIANIYKKLLIDEGLAAHFDEVYFPIMENHPNPKTGNLAIFQRVLGLTQNLNPNEGSSMTVNAKPLAPAQPSIRTTTPVAAPIPLAVPAKTGIWNKIKNGFASIQAFFKNLWNRLFHKAVPAGKNVPQMPPAVVSNGVRASSTLNHTPVSPAPTRSMPVEKNITLDNLVKQQNILGRKIIEQLGDASIGRIELINEPAVFVKNSEGKQFKASDSRLGLLFNARMDFVETFVQETRKRNPLIGDLKIVSTSVAHLAAKKPFISCTQEQLIKIYELYAPGALSQQPSAPARKGR